ncbi:hypothetical protein EXN66_Car004211 [Channa argus]|uniref:Uncharacterized protein n=1 Tax=Channa argus TaxID=215402 RepID=A0A6G1PEA5_CHAAH|nr:hypothetical protein EXN66_Car004211 [Channa argus]
MEQLDVGRGFWTPVQHRQRQCPVKQQSSIKKETESDLILVLQIPRPLLNLAVDFHVGHSTGL